MQGFEFGGDGKSLKAAGLAEHQFTKAWRVEVEAAAKVWEREGEG